MPSRIAHVFRERLAVPTLAALAALLVFAPLSAGQVIEFEQNGLKYRTLSRQGLTVMVAQMPAHIREYAIVQVAVANGSKAPQVIRPEQFRFERGEGNVLRAAAARAVVTSLIEKGNRNDVIKLVSAYESALYGMGRMQSSGGYYQRRQQALAEVSSTKLKAAAAASAIALVEIKLPMGQSTDGAVFFPSEGKPLGNGKLIVHTAADDFVFELTGDSHANASLGK